MNSSEYGKKTFKNLSISDLKYVLKILKIYKSKIWIDEFSKHILNQIIMIYHFFIFGEMHLPFTVKGSCAGKFCFNGGFCDGSSSTYKCLCRLGFSGINCSESKLTMYYRMHVSKVL